MRQGALSSTSNENQFRPTSRGRRWTLAAVATLAAAAALLVGAPALAGAGGTTLSAGETLYGAQNQNLRSSDGRYEARMQPDGNFVVYGPTGPLWSTNTSGSNARLTMQGDGNLVIYADQGVIFSTNTAGRGGNRILMQTDGNLVLYGGSAVWATQNPGERAIQWFYNRIGATNYEGQCERAVENAFGTGSVYASALANWGARAKQTPYTNAPRGSLVFYKTSEHGHVAISLGGGRVITTSAVGRKIGVVGISFFIAPAKPALGWAYAPW
jgi:hypothetical protein